MKKSFRYRNALLYFSRWSRKGYAVFAALGKRVAISTVRICVSESALLKSARKGVIVSEARCAQENSAQADDVFLLKKEELPVSMGKMCAGENGMNLKNITGQRGMPFAGVPLFYN